MADSAAHARGGASGVGVETDPQAAALARETVVHAGSSDRAEIVEQDVRRYLAVPGERFDLAVLANVIYYVARADRTAMELPDLDDLSAQLRGWGWSPTPHAASHPASR